MVARSRGLELDEAAARQAVAAIRSVPPHPDVVPALERLRAAKYRRVALPSSSQAALADRLKNAGLDGIFEAAWSVEEVGPYKPHAHVYRWAARRAGADVSECLMVAAHGWDVAGAAWAGMRSAFVGRPGQQQFPLGPTPELEVVTLADLVDELTPWR